MTKWFLLYPRTSTQSQDEVTMPTMGGRVQALIVQVNRPCVEIVRHPTCLGKMARQALWIFSQFFRYASPKKTLAFLFSHGFCTFFQPILIWIGVWYPTQQPTTSNCHVIAVWSFRLGEIYSTARQVWRSWWCFWCHGWLFTTFSAKKNANLRTWADVAEVLMVF